MTIGQEGVNVTLGANVDQLVAAFSRAYSELERFERRSTTAASSLASLERQARQAGPAAAQGLSGLSQAGQQASQALQQTQQAGERAGAALRTTQQGAGAAASGLQGLGAAGERAAAGLDGVTGRARDAQGRFLGAGNAASQAGAQIGGMGASARTTQAQLVTLSVAAAAGFATLSAGIGYAVREFGSFEATLNTIAAVTGATQAELGRLGDAARAIGRDTQFSAQEAAQGFLELGKAGLTAEQQLQAMPGVVALAAASGTDLGKASEVAAAAVRGFGLEMDQTTRVADVLAQSANQSSVDVADLAESFKYVAPIANASSQSLEGIAAQLALLGNNGIKGSQAGTALKDVLAKLQSPSQEAAKVIGAIGLQVADASGKMRPLGELIRDLAEKTAKFNQVSQAKIFEQLFGLEALPAISAMVNTVRQTPEEMARLEAAMAKAGGSAQKMADTMNQGINAELRKLKGSISTAAMALGEEMAPELESVVKLTTDWLNAFSEADPATRALAASVLETTAVVLGLAAGIATVIGGAKLLAIAFGLLVDGAGFLLGILGSVAAYLTTQFVAAFSVATVAGSSTFMAIVAGAGSVLLPIAAVVAAVYTIVTAWRAVTAAAAEALAMEQAGEQASRSARLQIVGRRQARNAELRAELASGDLSPAERAIKQDQLRRGEAFVGTERASMALKPLKLDVAPVKPAGGGGGATFALPSGGGGGGGGAPSAAAQAAKEQSQYLQQLRENDLASAERAAKAERAALDDKWKAGKLSAADYYQAVDALDQASHRRSVALLADKLAATKPQTQEAARIAGQLAAELEQYETEQATKRRERQAQAQAETVKALEDRADVQRDASQRELTLLEAGLARGLVSTADYNTRRRELAEADLAAELAVIDRQIRGTAEGTPKRLELERKRTAKLREFAQERLQVELDEAAKRLEVAQAVADGQAELADERRNRELAALDDLYQRQVLSATDYYARRDELDESAYQAELDRLAQRFQFVAEGTRDEAELLAQAAKLDEQLTTKRADNARGLQQGLREESQRTVGLLTAGYQALGQVVDGFAQSLREAGDTGAADQMERLAGAIGAASDATAIMGNLALGPAGLPAAITGTINLLAKGVNSLVAFNGQVAALQRQAVAFRRTLDVADATPSRATAETTATEFTKASPGPFDRAALERFVRQRAAAEGVDAAGLGTLVDLVLTRNAAEANIAKIEAQLRNPLGELSGGNQRLRQALPNLRRELAATEREIAALSDPARIIDDAAAKRATIAGSAIPAALKSALTSGNVEAEYKAIGDTLARLALDPTANADTVARLSSRYQELGRQLSKDLGTIAPEVSANLQGLLEQRAQLVLDAEQGGRDEAGRRISLEAQTQLQLDKLDRDHSEAVKRRKKDRAELDRQQAKAQEADLLRVQELETQIYQSRQDEEKRVRAIEAEGLAAKAQTIEQGKRDRIAEVRAEGSKARTTAQAQIDGIREQMRERFSAYQERVAQLDDEAARADAEHANARTRIQTEATERTAAHVVALRQLDEKIGRERTLAGIIDSQLQSLQRIATLREQERRGWGGDGGSGTTGATAGTTTASGPQSIGTGFVSQTFDGRRFIRTDTGLYAELTASGAMGSTFTASAIDTLKAIGQLPGGFQAFAEGGLVTQPTLALSGEAGPELYLGARLTRDLMAGNVTLGRPGGGGMALTINVGTLQGTRDSIRELAREVQRVVAGELRLRGNHAT